MQQLYLGLFLACCLVRVAGFNQNIGRDLYSNYSGLSAVLSNPAGIIDIGIYSEVNLLSGSLFADNNFFYIPSKGFRPAGFLKNPGTISHYQNVPDPGLTFEGAVCGPAYLVSTKKESFGFFTSLRAVGRATIPLPLVMLVLNGTTTGDNFDSTRISGADARYLVWGELGGHYARVLNPGHHDNWYLGANLKLLIGFQSGFVQSDPTTYSFEKQLLTIDRLNLKYAYTFGNGFFQPSGLGGALDIGLMYVKGGTTRATDIYVSLSRQSIGKYKFKTGLSITDLGFISFFQNSREIQIQSDYPTLIHDIGNLEYKPLDTVNQVLLTAIYGQYSPELFKYHFTVPLTPGISWQLDYVIKDHWMANAQIVVPILFSGSRDKPPMRIILCPRYSSPNFEVWLPFSYNPVFGFQAGLAIRYQWLTLGTESLVSLWRSQDFTRLNGYLRLSIPLKKST